LFWQVLCKHHPRVEPHSQQTLADCTAFKVQIANSSQMPQKVFARENLKNSDGSPIEVEMIDNRTGSWIIELIKGSLQPYMAKMGNMEPQHIAKLVSSDVNQKLKPLIYQQTIQCVESYIAMVGSEDPKHIASKVSLHVLPQLGLLVHHQNSPSVVEQHL
jgi:hypothetical protein